jgi:hydroxymethylpyrimidine/phosphomethylpyrimidine kinase
VQEIDPAIVKGQITAVYDDITVDAVKVGMLSSVAIIEAVYTSLVAVKANNIVLDPVMVSKTGFALLKKEAETALRGLVSLADIVTPNIPEAEILSCFSITDETGMEKAARRIATLGEKNVLIKGGHRVGKDATDILLLGGPMGAIRRIPGERIPTPHTHGTGCTLSSAIACGLAQGETVEKAVQDAKAYITQAIRDCYPLGHGTGPVGHLAELYRKAGLRC